MRMDPEAYLKSLNSGWIGRFWILKPDNLPVKKELRLACVFRDGAGNIHYLVRKTYQALK